jgi:2-polyprenyl-3-methyl-5-hydroxy-6-metoxy-1,4-benzoquinol methylase
MPETAQLEVPAEMAGLPLVQVLDVPECEVCGSHDSVDYAWGYDYEYRSCRNLWRFVTCRSCGHVWLNPRPRVEALDVIYPPTYFSYHYEEIPAVARRGKELLDRLKMRQILKACSGTPRRYLDVGCGDGRYLEALGRAGVPRDGLYGLELDQDIVDGLRQRGLQAYRQRVETCDVFDNETFDLITMFHVIEHVDSPRSVTDRLAGWLKPGGVLALETPNLDSLDARLFRAGKWGGYHIPRHFHLFKPDTLRRMVEAAGLRVVDVRFQTGHAFWMYSMHHVLRYNDPPHPRLARLFDPLASVIPLAGFTGFDRLRASVGARTSAMLLIARREA